MKIKKLSYFLCLIVFLISGCTSFSQPPNLLDIIKDKKSVQKYQSILSGTFEKDLSTSDTSLNIFKGDIKVTITDTITGSKYILIYGNSLFALICAPVFEMNSFICFPTFVKTWDIPYLARFDEIISDEPVWNLIRAAKIEITPTHFKMQLAPVLSCSETGECDFKDTLNYKRVR